MKTAFKIIAAAMLVIPGAGALHAQDTRTATDGTKLYVKSCDKGSERFDVCTLCTDKALTGKCAVYIYDKDKKQAIPTALNKTQATDILGGKALAQATGMPKRTDRKLEYYVIENGNATTYLFSTPTGVSMYSFQPTNLPGSAFPHGTMQKPLSPIDQQGLRDCINDYISGYQDCMNNLPGGVPQNVTDANIGVCRATLEAGVTACGKAFQAFIRIPSSSFKAVGTTVNQKQ